MEKPYSRGWTTSQNIKNTRRGTSQNIRWIRTPLSDQRVWRNKLGLLSNALFNSFLRHWIELARHPGDAGRRRDRLPRHRAASLLRA